jgi:transcriptional regulator with XRE-family HTH domain
MRKNFLSQTELANLADVSQSTVSRALSGRLVRHGQARARLFIYAQLDDVEVAAGDEGRTPVIRAFDKIWDGSHEHAAAVAKVIEALADLRTDRSRRKGRR